MWYENNEHFEACAHIYIMQHIFCDQKCFNFFFFLEKHEKKECRNLHDQSSKNKLKKVASNESQPKLDLIFVWNEEKSFLIFRQVWHIHSVLFISNQRWNKKENPLNVKMDVQMLFVFTFFLVYDFVLKTFTCACFHNNLFDVPMPSKCSSIDCVMKKKINKWIKHTSYGISHWMIEIEFWHENDWKKYPRKKRRKKALINYVMLLDSTKWNEFQSCKKII